MKHRIHLGVILCLVLFSTNALAQEIKVLINQIGYEPNAPKRAVILGHAGDDVTALEVIDQTTGKEMLSAPVERTGAVDQWKDWIFWSADFSAVRDEGTYALDCQTNRGEVRSFPFIVQKDLLERNTLSNVIYYFKGQRCSGLLDKADANLRFQNSNKTADVHGGWYDATGDYGKHLSHLSFSNYFNPQQIPFTDWSLFKAYEQLERRDPGNASPDKDFRQYKRRLLDEAMYGADYLVRVKNPNGSFYRSVDAPGGEKRAEDRRIATEGKGFAIKTLATKNRMSAGATPPAPAKYPYEVGYRNGGGVAIAALAVASRFDVSGEFSNATYLQTARDAFEFLEKHNLEFANDGRENIVDDYCALMAATELFRATGSQEYKDAADRRAGSLLGRLISSGQYSDYWRADDGDRPFFHAADAGMPVVSLLNYYEIADAATQAKILQTVRKAMESEWRITGEVVNPFGYARQLVQSTDGSRRTEFFFPHDTETAPWWQGENARLSSLAYAARATARYFPDDPAFQARLRAYAWNQLNWILGLNPFDVCMLQGSGHNNVAYMFFNSYEYTNAPGGICNGITSGEINPHDIDFNRGFAVTGKDEDWRWGEQWLPHASWYLLAISIEH
jgi:Glycosyl hydrolase family 9/Cellulase N-terminal ig-like domain